MNFRILLLSGLFLIVFSAQSFATNYYVSTSGSDANNGTSLATPFLTLAKAVTKAVVAGDSIIIRSGTYVVNTTIKITKSGTAANHIVITVYKPDMVDANSRPVFDFSGMTVSSANRGIQITGVSYMDVYGIVVKGAGDNGLIIDGGGACGKAGKGYITVEFCSFTRNRDTGFQIGGLAHHIYVINCDSYENADLGTGTTTLGGNADGFTPKIDPGDTIIYRGCRAWMNSDDGWDGYLKVFTTDGNACNLGDNMTTFLEDCWSFHNGYYWKDGSTTSSENGNGFKLGGSALKNQAHNFVVTRCLSFDNKAKGYDQNNSAGSQYIYNCTSFNNGDYDFGLNSSGVTYTTGAQLVLINDLSIGPKGVTYPATSSSRKVTTTTNSFLKTSTLTSPEIVSFDTTGLTAMRDVNGNLPDISFMHLKATAPTPYTYIEKGTLLPNVYYHGGYGVSYYGTVPDLGAFELLSVAPVKMISFGAAADSKGVTLNWKMANEYQNKGWAIERASVTNSTDWKEIGFVNGIGNSTSPTAYSFLDNTVTSGEYYYRLRQVDYSGSFAYTNAILVKAYNNGQANLEVSVSPNPVKSSATVSFTVPESGKVLLQVFNMNGQLLSTLVNENLSIGSYQKLINGQALTPGEYLLKLNVGNKSITNTFLRAQ